MNYQEITKKFQNHTSETIRILKLLWKETYFKKIT
jgi:hypothetical protein